MTQRILVVEDNDLNRKLFCDVLQASGFAVEPVADGEVAIERARSFIPNLVIMDIQLHNVSGLDLIAGLKQDDVLCDVGPDGITRPLGPLQFLSGNAEAPQLLATDPAGDFTRVTWSNGPVDLTAGWRFIDSVTVDKYLLPLRSRAKVPPLYTLMNPVLPKANYLDLGAAWNVTDKLQVSGGVNNVLGWGPPIVCSSAGYGNTWPATYDPYGQTFYFDFKVKFD